MCFKNLFSIVILICVAIHCPVAQIIFPAGSGIGILVALAVPVDLEEQAVFMSYNFECNYGMPTIPTHITTGPLNRLGLNQPFPAVEVARELNELLEDEETTTEFSEDTSNIVKRSFNEDKIIFTRRGFYELIESRLTLEGRINGKKCLLLAICETAKYPFLESNGVIGHILHVILTPSSSMNENLPSEYEKAENFGSSGDCRKYEQHCEFNVLNLFSKLF